MPNEIKVYDTDEENLLRAIAKLKNKFPSLSNILTILRNLGWKRSPKLDDINEDEEVRKALIAYKTEIGKVFLSYTEILTVVKQCGWIKNG